LIKKSSKFNHFLSRKILQNWPKNRRLFWKIKNIVIIFCNKNLNPSFLSTQKYFKNIIKIKRHMEVLFTNNSTKYSRVIELQIYWNLRIIKNMTIGFKLIGIFGWLRYFAYYFCLISTALFWFVCAVPWATEIPRTEITWKYRKIVDEFQQVGNFSIMQ